jgi:hypothetical protein
MKLALLYALLDHRREINVEHLNAALAAWTYCQDSLVEVFGDSTGDRLADKVLNVLRDAAPEPLSLKQLRDATGRNYTAEQTGAALNALATFGLAEREPTATGGRGRPAERWRATTRQEHTHT